MGQVAQLARGTAGPPHRAEWTLGWEAASQQGHRGFLCVIRICGVFSRGGPVTLPQACREWRGRALCGFCRQRTLVITTPIASALSGTSPGACQPGDADERGSFALRTPGGTPLLLHNPPSGFPSCLPHQSEASQILVEISSPLLNWLSLLLEGQSKCHQKGFGAISARSSQEQSGCGDSASPLFLVGFPLPRAPAEKLLGLVLMAGKCP